MTEQLNLPLDWEGLVNEGIEARKMGDAANWRLGDLAGGVETHYGDCDLQKYSNRIGVAYESLRDYQRVSKRFVERSTNLTWSHHRVVAAQDSMSRLLPAGSIAPAEAIGA